MYSMQAAEAGRGYGTHSVSAASRTAPSATTTATATSSSSGLLTRSNSHLLRQHSHAISIRTWQQAAGQAPSSSHHYHRQHHQNNQTDGVGHEGIAGQDSAGRQRLQGTQDMLLLEADDECMHAHAHDVNVHADDAVRCMGGLPSGTSVRTSGEHAAYHFRVNM